MNLEHTKNVYHNHAEAFDGQRSKTLFEKSWLDACLALIPEGSSILDLGCGSGDPIAGYFLAQGMNVTGVDFAPGMLSLARRRFPQARWIQQDICSLSLEESFSALIAWGSFFHLTPSQQRDSFALLDAHIEKNGVLLMTVGHEYGEVTGTVDGQQVYHASLSPEEYRLILDSLGYCIHRFVLRDPLCQEHSIILAQKSNDRRAMSWK